MKLEWINGNPGDDELDEYVDWVLEQDDRWWERRQAERASTERHIQRQRSRAEGSAERWAAAQPKGDFLNHRYPGSVTQ